MIAIPETGERVISLTLPVELTNGNDGRGSRWFSSKDVRNKIEAMLRKMGFVSTPFRFPVIVHVTRIVGKSQRLWDSSSPGRGNWKEIEDAMVACGWFVDDGPKWIYETRFFQDANRKEEGPAVVVEVFKVKELEAK